MKKLEITSGKELLDSILPESRFAISGLLSEGVHILGGSPKIGKSWMVLWWCLQISKGENIWNYETSKGTVLYLALEDSLSRLQSRMMDLCEEAPESLKLAIRGETLTGGLKEQIEDFCIEHPDTRIIVIDTLQKIRGVPDSSNLYAQDYKDMDVLKELAFRFNTSILLVHHLRKQNSDDPLNNLSGSTGLSGEVDGIFILQKSNRTGNQAKLFCTGRDISQTEINLVFNEASHLWINTDDCELVPLTDSVVAQVTSFLDSLDDNSFMGSATEQSDKIFAKTGEQISNVTLSKKLIRHSAQLKDMGYTCRLSRTKSTRLLSLTKIC